MKILLRGFYGFGNFGDDLLMKIVYDRIRTEFKESEVYIFSNNSPNNSRFLQKSRNYNKYIHNILGESVSIVDWYYKGQFDLIVDGGGGVFFDYSKGGFFRQNLNYLLRVIHPRVWISAEKLARVLAFMPRRQTAQHKVGLGISIGPYEKDSRKFVRDFIEISSYDLLMVRDHKSYEFLESINFFRFSQESFDLGFALNFPEKRLEVKCPKSTRICFVVLNWEKAGKQYLENIIEAADELRKTGYSVSFFSFHKEDDISITGFLEDIVYWDPHIMTIEDFLRMINEFDIIISGRFHGAVVAAGLSKPLIVLKYSQKLEELSKQFGNSIFTVEKPFYPKEVVEAVQLVSKRLKDQSAEIELNVGKIKAHLNEDLVLFWEKVKALF